MIIDGGERSTLRYFSEKPTALAKEYKLWLTKDKNSKDFQNNQSYIHQLFSCPTEDLKDVMFPLAMYYGQRVFQMDYQSYNMTNDDLAKLNRNDWRVRV